MTTPLPEAEPHAAAFVDALRVSTPDSLTIGYGVAPAGENMTPYAVVYPDGGGAEDTRLSRHKSGMFMVFLVHGVGETPEQCLWVVDKVRNAVLGRRIVVPNRVCAPITQDIFPSQMMRDWNAQPPLYQQLIEFELRSQAA